MYLTIQRSKLLRWPYTHILPFVCFSPFLFLCSSLIGIPPLAHYAQLELTVVYNACLCSVAHSQFSEAELLLKQATQRGRKASASLSMTSSYEVSSYHCCSLLGLVSCSSAQHKERICRLRPTCVLENSS